MGWERLCGQVIQAVVTAVVLLTLTSPVRSALPWVLAGIAGVAGCAALVVSVAARLGRSRPARAARPLPLTCAQLARLGITIARQVPTVLHLNETNAAYLAAKARRGGHDLLSRSLERAAGPHRHAGQLPGPADLGVETL